MANFLRTLILAAVLGSGTSFAHEPAKLVRVKFNVFALNPIESLVYVPEPDSEPHSLTFYSAARSSTYSYHGPEKLTFFRREKEQLVRVAECSLPTGVSQVTLIFFPSGQGGADELAYRVIAVSDEMDRIPPGSFVVLNLSGRPYGMRVGKSRFRLEPMEMSGAMAGNASNYLSITNPSDAKGVVGGHQFGVAGNQRVLVLVFPPVRKTSLQPIARALTDELPDGEKKKK